MQRKEVVSHYLGEISGAITFEELSAMFTVKEIDPASFTGENEEATCYGKGFAKSGGVTTAVLKVVEEETLTLILRLASVVVLLNVRRHYRCSR